MPMQPSLDSLLWFLAIIAMIPVALWLLKRSPMVGGGLGKPGTPKPVAVLPLSAQQKIVTVEVGQGDERLWLVLGVSAQGVRTLHTMAAQGQAPDGKGTGTRTGDTPPALPASTFAQLLSRLRGGPNGPDSRAN